MTLRNKIDTIDAKIVLLLKERMGICKSIGAFKVKNGLGVKDHRREDEVYLHVMAKALEAGIDTQKIEKILKDIIDLGVFVQGAE